MPTLRLENGQTLQLPDGTTPELAQRYADQANGIRPGGAPPAPQEDTFLGESGLSGLAGLGDHFMQKGINPPSVLDAIQQMYHGQVAETSGEQQQAKDQFSQGNYGGALAHFIAGTPIIGHPLVHGAHNIASGNVGGLLGDLLALGGPAAMEDLGGGARTAESLYKGAVPFGHDMSLRDIDAATQLGLNEKITATRGGVEKLGRTSQPDSVIGGLEDQVQPYVTGTNGAQKVNTATVLTPVMEKLRASMLDRTPEGQKFSNDLNDEVSGWIKAHPQGLDVEGAHMEKRAMYKRISDAQYADNSSGIPGPAKVAKEELARGLKDSVSEVHPEISGLNDQMHSAIQLQDSLTKQLKARPDVAKNALLWAMGIAGGEAATMMGHSTLGAAGLVALAAKQALNNPTVATRLALAFHDVPEMTQIIGTMGRPLRGLGMAARPGFGGQTPLPQPQDVAAQVQNLLGIHKP